MSNAIAQTRNPVIENLKEYIELKAVRDNTGFIGGKIFYDGSIWDEVTYNFVYPFPRLKYKTVQLGSDQIEK